MDVRIAVFVSGAGSNLQALLDDPHVGRSVVLVVSNRPEATALGRARARGVETAVVDPRQFPSRDAHDRALLALLEEREIEFVLNAGYMRILTPVVVRPYEGRWLNIHPSLLPAFPGAHPVRDALEWGAKVTGVTVHLVDEEVDHGPIVAQEAVPVFPDDDEATLHARIQEVEHRLYPHAARLLAEGRLKVEARRVHVLDDDREGIAVIEVLPVRRALVAVADKRGVVEFAERLAKLGAEVVSTGNTAQAIAEAGVPVTPVSDVTGFPEMLGGRVKTLHPRIHGGILADKRRPEHLAELADHGIEPFDLVAVNLYPFRETVGRGVTTDEAVEQIDIGGPAMVRAAAKNFESTGVVVDPGRYEDVVDELERLGGLSRALRLALAAEAFAHTASYDAAIDDFFAGLERDAGVQWSRVDLELRPVSGLRYGENPHQRGALYLAERGPGPLGGADVLQGKEMSYNNWLDAEAARAVAGLFDPSEPVAAIVKHHNPCGVAAGPTLAEAYLRALDGDRVSAFGGIVAFNGEVDEEAAAAMAPVFTEVVVAPSFTEGALGAFEQRANLRVLRAPLPLPGGQEVRPIDGGALVQDADTVTETRADMWVVTTRQPTREQWEDLLFGWKVAARAKSNAIVLATGRATVAVGAGQMNRVTSVDIAARHAGDRARGASMASDAFFPFRDGIDRAGQAGVAAVIQPGGSVRDEEVIAAAEEHGMAMVFTGRRHFRH